VAKLTRNRLARGTKLTKQHVEGAVSAAAYKLGAINIERENLTHKWAPVRLTWHVPVLDSSFFRYASDGRTIFTIPFPIVPFQDKFDLDGRQLDSSPQQLILDEFSLSFDLRDEAGAVCDKYQAVAGSETGKINWLGLPAYAMHVSLDEKPQTFFGGSNAARTTILSADLGSERLAGQTFRDNPFSIGGLNKLLSPYRTYLLTLNAPKLYDATTGYRCAIVSLQFTLRLRAALVVRDGPDFTGDVQNMPSPWNGAKTPKTVPQTAIAGDDPITEARIQGNLQAVDAVFQRKLDGGYTAESLAPANEQVRDDSCYECIVVPLWQNCQSPMVLAQDTNVLPYVGAGPYKSATEERRRIPIAFPWVLHHVIVAENLMGVRVDGMAAAATAPTSNNLYKRVGVGLLQGLRADDFAYQQIAYTEWTNNGGAVPANVVDDIAICENAQHGGWRLIHCPLRGAGGNSYYGTGKPIFIGKTNYYGSARTNINAGPSATLGRETLIEVRWGFDNTVDGLADNAHGGVELPEALYSGYGGNFVYLIGKKTVCGDPADIPA